METTGCADSPSGAPPRCASGIHAYAAGQFSHESRNESRSSDMILRVVLPEKRARCPGSIVFGPESGNVLPRTTPSTTTRRAASGPTFSTSTATDSMRVLEPSAQVLAGAPETLITALGFCSTGRSKTPSICTGIKKRTITSSTASQAPCSSSQGGRLKPVLRLWRPSPTERGSRPGAPRDGRSCFVMRD